MNLDYMSTLPEWAYLIIILGAIITGITIIVKVPGMIWRWTGKVAKNRVEIQTISELSKVAPDLINLSKMSPVIIALKDDVAEVKINTALNSEKLALLKIHTEKINKELSKSQKIIADALVVSTESIANNLVLSNQRIADNLVLSTQKIADNLEIYTKKLAANLELITQKTAIDLDYATQTTAAVLDIDTKKTATILDYKTRKTAAVLDIATKQTASDLEESIKAETIA
jgi:hypothetical protein